MGVAAGARWSWISADCNAERFRSATVRNAEGRAPAPVRSSSRKARRQSAGKRNPTLRVGRWSLEVGSVKRLKGVWWMPWHREAMKDVIRCEKLRGAANEL